MTFRHHGLRETLRPARFRLSYLRQRVEQAGIGRLALSVLQQREQIADALVGLVFIPQVAAEQIIAQIQPVLHHLRARIVDRLLRRQRGLHRVLRGVLPAHRDHVNEKQNQHDRQNRAKPVIEFLADSHEKCLRSPPATAAAGPRSPAISCAPRNRTPLLPPILSPPAQTAISSKRPVQRPPATDFHQSPWCSSLSLPRKSSLRFSLCRSRSSAAPVPDIPAASSSSLFVSRFRPHFLAPLRVVLPPTIPPGSLPTPS